MPRSSSGYGALSSTVGPKTSRSARTSRRVRSRTGSGTGPVPVWRPAVRARRSSASPAGSGRNMTHGWARPRASVMRLMYDWGSLYRAGPTELDRTVANTVRPVSLAMCWPVATTARGSGTNGSGPATSPPSVPPMPGRAAA